MAPSSKHGKRKRQRGSATVADSSQVEKEIESLQKRLEEETPNRGYAPPSDAQVAFRALPLSQATLRGLGEASYSTMTAIQNACIPHALAGRDVLGAAKTGSGKTLAFLVPLLERLYHARMAPTDGLLGAIVLSPTRELAGQIFDVLRNVGAYHNFTAGLLVGGKREFKLEQKRVSLTNILVATPGRLLQHLEQTPYLDASQLQVLVLDEADRILDMGFRPQMIRILDYLPTFPAGRQTMLFSATQTKKVSDLATLSLHQPEYLGVHDKASTSTPDSLQRHQSMVVVPLHHKLNAVYSFIKSHLKHKSILFMASSSQVRHAWDLFCSLQPGIPILALHGKLVQAKRNQIYRDYCQREKAVLFATDVAARGLDFPNVDWVVQVDAPEDTDMYIHRVGRTARYKSKGKSLLLVTPPERDYFVEMLQTAKIPIRTNVSINPSKTMLVTQRAAALAASNPTKLGLLAKKAFRSYVRSLQLSPHVTFDIRSDLNLDEYATSLGLAATPSLRFLKATTTGDDTNRSRQELRAKKNINYKLHKLKEQIKAEKLAKRIAKLGGDAAAAAASKKRSRSADDEVEGLLVVKQTHVPDDDGDDEDTLPHVDIHQVTTSRKAFKKIRIDGTGNTGQRTTFDEDGQEVRNQPRELLRMAAASKDHQDDDDDDDDTMLQDAHEDYMRQVRERLAVTKEIDRAEERQRIKEKHRKKRQQAKKALEDEKNEDDETKYEVTLGGGDEGNDDGASSDDSSSSSTDSTSSSSSGNSDEGESDDDDDEEDSSEVDLQAQEELALAMIRQGA